MSKEGLQSVVDDKQQVNALSTKDLRNLFKLRSDTPSDTHDKLKCERCKIIHDDAEMKEKKVLPKKLAACLELVNRMAEQEDANYFLNPLNPEEHNVTKEHYEKKVKQPIDLGSIQKRLLVPQHQNGKGIQPYKSVSNVSKDVNRIFSNVMKVWSPEEDSIADAARRLHSWWVTQWQELVPILMTMTLDTEVKEDGADDEDGGKDMMESCTHLNNERGDDYQEQIGMPDEENMRCWSHHHKADTVDDPIFRAAMRGYDSVSFVFGLEVTWSKIQQRQQEEEDRQAMKELEEMEELQKLQEDSDGENEETLVGKDVDVSEEGMDVDTKSNMPVEDGVTSPFISDSQVASQDENGGTPEAQIIESPSSSTDVEVISVGSVENRSPQESPPKKSAVWACPRCTMENILSRKKCEACGKTRPRKCS